MANRRSRTAKPRQPTPPPATAAPEEARAAPYVAPGSGQVLTFTLAGAVYALTILQIREILELAPVTRVPTTPPWLRGVMNLRGSVVPVVDLAVRFGLAAAPDGATAAARPCVVIIESDLDGEPATLGLVVDSVDEVVDLAADSIAPPPRFGTVLAAEYLRGVGSVGDRLVLILDADRLLAPAELMTATGVAEQRLAGDGGDRAGGGPNATG